MTAYPEHPLSLVLTPSRQSVGVNEENTYNIAGIYSFGRGLIRRPPIQGSQTAYRSLTPLQKDQLVMSKLNAWEGAITVVPEEFADL
jgi:type I restriction enzyme S subunit